MNLEGKNKERSPSLLPKKKRSAELFLRPDMKGRKGLIFAQIKEEIPGRGTTLKNQGENTIINAEEEKKTSNQQGFCRRGKEGDLEEERGKKRRLRKERSHKFMKKKKKLSIRV